MTFFLANSTVLPYGRPFTICLASACPILSRAISSSVEAELMSNRLLFPAEVFGAAHALPVEWIGRTVISGPIKKGPIRAMATIFQRTSLRPQCRSNANNLIDDDALGGLSVLQA